MAAESLNVHPHQDFAKVGEAITVGKKGLKNVSFDRSSIFLPSGILRGFLQDDRVLDGFGNNR